MPARERAVHAACVLGVENRPIPDSLERLLDALGLVAEHDDQRIEARLRCASDHTADERFTLELHEQLVLSHARRGSSSQHDAGHRSSAISSHGWSVPFTQVPGLLRGEHRQQLADDADRQSVRARRRPRSGRPARRHACRPAAPSWRSISSARARGPSRPMYDALVFRNTFSQSRSWANECVFDHDQRARVDGKPLDVAIGSQVEEPLRRWKAIRGSERLPMIHHRDRKPRLRCVRHERTRIVTGAAHDQLGRRVQDLGEDGPRAVDSQRATGRLACRHRGQS